MVIFVDQRRMNLTKRLLFPYFTELWPLIPDVSADWMVVTEICIKCAHLENRFRTKIKKKTLVSTDASLYTGLGGRQNITRVDGVANLTTDISLHSQFHGSLKHLTSKNRMQAIMIIINMACILCSCWNYSSRDIQKKIQFKKQIYVAYKILFNVIETFSYL
jgi:hypothetical protein